MLRKMLSPTFAMALVLAMVMAVLVTTFSSQVVAQNIETGKIEKINTKFDGKKEVIEITPKVSQVIKQTIETPSRYTLSVINYNITPADVDLVAFDLEGNEVGRETVTVAAGENTKINIRKIFGGQSLKNLSTVDVQSFVRTVDYDANTYGYAYANALQLPVAFFSQRDSRWSGNKMGTCSGTKSTIGEIGCTITSIAMAGAARVSNFNPASLNSYLSTKDKYGNPTGYSGGCNVVWKAPENIDGPNGFLYFNSGYVVSASNLKSLIDAGKFPVTKSIRFPKSTHWVVIVGYKNTGSKLSDFYYLDPWDTSAIFHYIGDTDNFVSATSIIQIYN